MGVIALYLVAASWRVAARQRPTVPLDVSKAASELIRARFALVLYCARNDIRRPGFCRKSSRVE
jgi:hypothetical protein